RDDSVVGRGYPIVLRRIADPDAHTPQSWPYRDENSALVRDSSGPFGNAVRFNQGYIFGEVPRKEFDQTPLDISGRRPFTLIAWVKFIGTRHLVAGIWDEGGWNKYGGRRQMALFGGLFGSRSVIAHVSATGAASYPQSTVPGSQYARCRAIDGQDFGDNQWVAMAMTCDPGRGEVVAYTNGVATPTEITDPVAGDVFRPESPTPSNPFRFPWPVYSPRAFVVKFNGYSLESSGVYEHWLEVDTVAGTLTYRRDAGPGRLEATYRVKFDARRGARSLLKEPLFLVAENQTPVGLPKGVNLETGDRILVSLEEQKGRRWQTMGSEIDYGIREGAPFTFGRALGLGNEPIEHGTQLFLDGVAVFDRVLTADELAGLSFVGRR
ncbi:MAG: hypothetical protein ACYC6Y_11450, partial [Thermoguttaceae bacterium]